MDELWWEEEQDIVITKKEKEFILGDKFPTTKMWLLFRDGFIPDLLLKNKILLTRYSDKIANDYADTISILDDNI